LALPSPRRIVAAPHSAQVVSGSEGSRGLQAESLACCRRGIGRTAPERFESERGRRRETAAAAPQTRAPSWQQVAPFEEGNEAAAVGCSDEGEGKRKSNQLPQKSPDLVHLRRWEGKAAEPRARRRPGRRPLMPQAPRAAELLPAAEPPPLALLRALVTSKR